MSPVSPIYNWLHLNLPCSSSMACVQPHACGLEWVCTRTSPSTTWHHLKTSAGHGKGLAAEPLALPTLLTVSPLLPGEDGMQHTESWKQKLGQSTQCPPSRHTTPTIHFFSVPMEKDTGSCPVSPVGQQEAQRHLGICFQMQRDVAQVVKNLPTVQETRIRSLGWEDPLEKVMATHSSVLTWSIPWTEEPGSLSPWGCKELDTTE